MSEASYTTEQVEALDALAGALRDFVERLGTCQGTGLLPSDALIAIGIDVPYMFKGTVNSLLAMQVATLEESDDEELQT